MPMGRVSYSGTPGGIGSAGPNGDMAAIARYWLAQRQGPQAVPQSTPDQDAAFANAFGLPGAPGQAPPVMPPGAPPAGLEAAPRMAGQQFGPPPVQGGMPARPLPHPGQPMPGGVQVAPPRPQASNTPPPPTPMGRAGAGALQYLAQRIGQGQLY